MAFGLNLASQYAQSPKEFSLIAYLKKKIGYFTYKSGFLTSLEKLKGLAGLGSHSGHFPHGGRGLVHQGGYPKAGRYSLGDPYPTCNHFVTCLPPTGTEFETFGLATLGVTWGTGVGRGDSSLFTAVTFYLSYPLPAASHRPC